jgi:AraC-like DNA-binding protein
MLQIQLTHPKSWLQNWTSAQISLDQQSGISAQIHRDSNLGQCAIYELQDELFVITAELSVKRPVDFWQIAEDANDWFMLRFLLKGRETSQQVPQQEPVNEWATSVLFQSSTDSRHVRIPIAFQGTMVILMFSAQWLEKNLMPKQNPLKPWLAHALQTQKPIWGLNELPLRYQKLAEEILFITKQPTLKMLSLQRTVFGLLEWYADEYLYDPMPQTRHPISDQDTEALMRVKRIILDFKKEMPSVIALADEAGMSESKLRRLFKQVFGCPIYDYYQKHRMETARDLLRLGKMSIGEIGHAVGYHNLGHFANTFKKHFGVLPSEWK